MALNISPQDTFFYKSNWKPEIIVQATYWNVKAHTVSVADEVWKAILKRNKLAAAYYYRDEPEFLQLSTLTLNISEGEEVSSPVADQDRKSRRKLFASGNVPLDLESTTSKGEYLYTVESEGQMMYQFQNVLPPRPREYDPKKLGGSYTSSCGSSSSSKWWTPM
ncbi:hypothetical protein AAHA92_02735 [Salvia divinorum]|uniref:Uncharacterized protein n=1 Tax=Salvia divinorum TaxID=28513 RepID=A0ABD1IIX9_SALDI